jgi:hypothetical protein
MIKSIIEMNQKHDWNLINYLIMNKKLKILI